MIIEIDLVKLVRLGLNINEYLTILSIYKEYKGDSIPFYSSNEFLKSLEDNKWIELIDNDESVILTKKALKLVEEKDVNFDELFFLYPYKTPDGRVLRTKEKEISGRMTKDYKSLYDKYTNRIKNIKLHNDIVDATKIMLKDISRRGELKFLPRLETYINKNKWEDYIHLVGIKNTNMNNISGINTEKL